jgi:nucleoid-associated protein YgaU
VTSIEPPKPKGGFSKPFYGVPLWGWLLIGVTVGGGVYYMQSRPKAVPLVQSDAVGQGAGYTTVGAIAPTTTAEIQRILTNQDWSLAAQKDLVQKGHDPAEVATAVAMYVAGENLDSAQNQLINVALRDIGPLPQTPGSGSISKVKPLHTPNQGNLIGQLVAGFGSLVGLNDPNNPFAPYIAPAFNNIIDNGPISGVFQSVSDLVGGNVNINANPELSIPGIGDVGGNLSLNNRGAGGGIDLPSIGIPTPWGTIGLGGGGNASISSTANPSYQSYTVQAGDTLTSISLKMYGNNGGATKIYSANLNKIPNPSKLAVGTVLQIPAASMNA